jgi:hypothetical protein
MSIGPEQSHEQVPKLELTDQTHSIILERAQALLSEDTQKSLREAHSLLGFLTNPEANEHVVAQPQASAEAAQPIPAQETPQPVASATAEEPTAFEYIRHRTAKRTKEMFGSFRRSKAATAVGALAVGIAIGASMVAGDSESKPAKITVAEPALAQSGNSEATDDKETQAESGWKKDELTPNEEHRWLASGFPNIKKAETKKEAREAAGQYLKVIRGDEDTFKFIYDQIHGGDIEKDELFENGYSTPYAEKRFKELQLTLAMSDIRKGYASKDIRNPHNTGLDSNGDVVVATTSGVSGDTEAIIIELPNGKRIAIMHRCAQPVVEGKPQGVPEGPTDQPRIPGQPKQPEQPGQPEQPEQPNPMHPPADGPPPEAVQHRPDPGPTPGYPGRGNAEKVVGQQEKETPGGLDPTEYGTEAGGPGSSPGGGEESVVAQPPASAPSNPEYVPGTESPGTGEGNSTPAPTEGSDQTSGAGTDPGMPG